MLVTKWNSVRVDLSCGGYLKKDGHYIKIALPAMFTKNGQSMINEWSELTIDDLKDLRDGINVLLGEE